MFIREELPPVTEKAASALISVDRTAGIEYGRGEPLHPELEATGPSQYKFDSLVMYRYEDPSHGRADMRDVYSLVKTDPVFNNCLGLSDLRAICDLGIEWPFVDDNGHDAILLFVSPKSVVTNSKGHLYIPCLTMDEGEIYQEWRLLEGKWEEDWRILCFR